VVFDPSVEQILATSLSVSFTTVVGTACWCVRERCRRNSKLAIMDREVHNQLKLEGAHKKRPHRQLDRPRPPPRE
jgi:hypothetical protein